MKHIARSGLFALFLMVVLPAAVYAQASIAGVVRDTSGAVLPGVTVEAASPALIERTRSVISDGSGQFQIVNLRPGTYVVTFTLAGFNTVKREGVELTGSFAATLNVEMRVGALEETVTVTGESPIVDIQNVRQQRVVSRDVIDAIPTGRRVFDVGVLVPSVTNNQRDVGGSVGPGALSTLSSHGSRGADQRVTIGGMTVANLEGGGGNAAYSPNMGSAQEVSFDTSGSSAEMQTGGVAVNIVPKEGGNRYSGTWFATGLTSGFQGSNYSDDLKSRGLTSPNRIKSMYDVNPGFGGPIKRDTMWIYVSGRWNATQQWVGGMYANANAGKTTLPEAWLYSPDLSRPGVSRSYTRSVNGRITWQIDPKNKLSLFYDDQYKCDNCPGATATIAPEALTSGYHWPMQRFATVGWTSPLTSRLLLEANVGNRGEGWKGNKPYADGISIPVTEQSSGLLYHGTRTANYGVTYPWFVQNVWNVRGAVSYVTGSHALKFGVQDLWGYRYMTAYDNASHLSYRFNNGTPNQLTQRATPFTVNDEMRADFGLFVQDRWTAGRLTVNAGLRYDWFNSGYPEQHLGPVDLAPNRNITLPAGDLLNWKDLTPRVGLSYDLSGDGKTALKVTINKYVVGQALTGTFGDAANPSARLAYSVTRSWADANRDFVPNCDLTSPLANGECGPMSNQNFGNATPGLTLDPATLGGWGARAYNWEFGTSVQRQILPRMSVDLGYFRRIYGNFVTTDNRAVASTDYTAFQITAPVDARLPNGGGYTIAGLYDLNPNRVGQVDNYLTFSENFGKQIEHWNGVDVGVNARLGAGVQMQAGLSTGRTVTDNCDVLRALPEVSPLGGPYCHQETLWLTQVKGFATYIIPVIGVQTSATFQSVPGPVIAANYNAPNATIVPSLGRNLSANAANATINLIAPGSMYGERVHQLDLRFGKILRAGGTRTSLSVDIYNATNGNAVLTENSNFAVWRTPQTSTPARFAKISVQFDF